jgi:hypothetical protein
MKKRPPSVTPSAPLALRLGNQCRDRGQGRGGKPVDRGRALQRTEHELRRGMTPRRAGREERHRIGGEHPLVLVVPHPAPSPSYTQTACRYTAADLVVRRLISFELPLTAALYDRAVAPLDRPACRSDRHWCTSATMMLRQPFISSFSSMNGFEQSSSCGYTKSEGGGRKPPRRRLGTWTTTTESPASRQQAGSGRFLALRACSAPSGKS